MVSEGVMIWFGLLAVCWCPRLVDQIYFYAANKLIADAYVVVRQSSRLANCAAAYNSTHTIIQNYISNVHFYQYHFHTVIQY